MIFCFDAVPDPAEGYNPEAPAMTGPPPAPQPFWTSPPPGLFPPTTKNTPPPLPVRQRDLVAVPTLLDEAEDGKTYIKFVECIVSYPAVYFLKEATEVFCYMAFIFI